MFVIALYLVLNDFFFLFSRPPHQFYNPVLEDELEELTKKQFTLETNKKIKWVVKMFHEWCQAHKSLADRHHVQANLEDPGSLNEDALMYALCRFLTEVKKVDGEDFSTMHFVSVSSSNWKLSDYNMSFWMRISLLQYNTYRIT